MEISTQNHILGPFDQALTNLRASVLMMASLTKRALANAEKALFERDVSSCGVVIADDEEIDSLEVQIDREGLDILLKFQPVATDMRQVIAAMKMGNNIERVADQVVSIARRAHKLNQRPPLEEMPLLRPMFREAAAMFADSISFYADANQVEARKMKDRDRRLDEVNRELTERFADCMAEHSDKIREYLNCIFISRVLERIGDHATNICEEVVFLCAAEDIRHTHEAAPKPRGL
jgi:phosphate transport system protein